MTIIYKIGSGEIVSASEHPMSPAAVGLMLAKGGLAAIDGYCEIDAGYVRDKKLIVKPESPSAAHVFNTASGEWEVSVNKLVDQITANRNRLLARSDWTQLPDVPLATKEAWSAYRQALRDVPAQSGYPMSVQWPEPPK